MLLNIDKGVSVGEEVEDMREKIRCESSVSRYRSSGYTTPSFVLQMLKIAPCVAENMSKSKLVAA